MMELLMLRKAIGGDAAGCQSGRRDLLGYNAEGCGPYTDDLNRRSTGFQPVARSLSFSIDHSPLIIDQSGNGE